MLFAALSNEAILALAGAIYAAVKVVEKIYDDWRLGKLKTTVAGEAAAVAAKVEAVKETLAASDDAKREHLERQDEALATIAAKVDDVKRATGG